MIAEGIRVMLVAVVETKSGPYTASNSTASHMTEIAIDGHISGMSSRRDQVGLSGRTFDCSCETATGTHLPFQAQPDAYARACHPHGVRVATRWNTDRPALTRVAAGALVLLAWTFAFVVAAMLHNDHADV